MKRIFLYFIGVIILAAVIIGAISFSIQRKSLKSRITQNKQFGSHLQAEINSLQKDKADLESKNEKLSADVVSYLSSINKFQDENKQIKKKLTQKETKLEATEKTLQKFIKEQQPALEENIQKLEAELKKEKIRYSYNLGVAYTKAEMYEEAIDSYEQALLINPRNSKALYNCGLIYHMVIKNSVKAIEFYTKFVEIEPQGNDVEEVSGWIDELSK